MDNGSSSNKLNRELLRWIQSLDLAYSIKNVKRDFANGFLVAEIMSRYYDKDISMHSYDNGIGLKVKKDNWEQLVKLFNRLPDLESLANKSDIDAIIHCQSGAAVAFITKLYQCLTKRTIQSTAPPPNNNNTLHGVAAAATGAPVVKGRDAPEEIPPYAKTTGATLIREMMRAPEILETTDQNVINRKMRDVHAQHEENLQLDRLILDTPTRSANKAAVLRGSTKPVRNDENPVLMAQQVVKEVQIKSMNEKSLEKLRITREARESEALAASFGHNGGASFDGFGRGLNSNNNTELVQRRRPLDLLNETIGRRLATLGLLSRLEQRGGKDKFESFVETAIEGRAFSDQEIADTLREILDDMYLIAMAFLDFPKEFWRFVGLMFPFVLEHDPETELFTVLCDILVQIGQHCVRRDGTASTLLLTEYLLSKLTQVLLHGSPLKRIPMLQILYAYVPETPLAHLQAIKRLREVMGSQDIPLFIHLLSILLTMESQLDDTLVDLYHYYCGIGLETSCEKLRAASLSMLLPFLQYDVALVVDLLPRLTQFATRTAWWEVKAQLLTIASAFLNVVATETDRDFTDHIELALTIIEREFDPTASSNLRRIGLSHLAKNLKFYQELVPLYVDVLLSLPGVMAVNQLTELPVRGPSGTRYELQRLADQWDSVAIAKQLYYECKMNRTADPTVIQILYACFAQLQSSADDSQRHQVVILYEQMQSYLVLGLLDHEACDATTKILHMALTQSTSNDWLLQEALIDTLQKLVTKNTQDTRQQLVVRLLHQLNASADHSPSVRQCLEQVQAACDPTTFRSSLFQSLLAVN